MTLYHPLYSYTSNIVQILNSGKVLAYMILNSGLHKYILVSFLFWSVKPVFLKIKTFVIVYNVELQVFFLSA